MFKIKNINPEQQNLKIKVNKIKNLLAQTLFSVKNDKSFNLENQDCQFRKSKDSNTEPESIEEVLNKLQKGYLMVKHSRNTKQPHNKFVYLSEDRRHLCWKSMDKQDEKKFLLTSIAKICKKGCKSALKNKLSLNESSRTLIIFSTERNLQLEAATEFDADIFRYQLNRAIKYAQSMHQNYPYSFD